MSATTIHTRVEHLEEEVNALTTQLSQQQKECGRLEDEISSLEDLTDELEKEVSSLEYRLEGRSSNKVEKLVGFLMNELKMFLPQVKEVVHPYQWTQIQADHTVISSLVDDLVQEEVGQ